MRVVLVLAIFTCYIASCLSLRCYNCMSSRGEVCDDTSQMQVKDCEVSAEASSSLHVQPVCLKVIKDIRGIDYITRSCAFSGNLIDICKQHLSVEHCSTCTSNLCNKSSTIFVNLSLLILPLIGSYLQFFHNMFHRT